jgi:hypothetical protein
LEVCERNVLDESRSAACSAIGERRAAKHLNTRAVLRVLHYDVRNCHVCDDVRLTRVLAERADRDAMATIAVEVANHNVCAIRLEGHAVVCTFGLIRHAV